MHKIALYSNHLTSNIYEIYHKLYLGGIVKNPIIYTNQCNIKTNMNIPIFYTKYIFNQYYDIIISDTVDAGESCCKLIIYKDTDTLDSILAKIKGEL